MREYLKLAGAIAAIGGAVLFAALFLGFVVGAFVGAIGGFVVLMIRMALAVLT